MDSSFTSNNALTEQAGDRKVDRLKWIVFQVLPVLEKQIAELEANPSRNAVEDAHLIAARDNLSKAVAEFESIRHQVN